MRPWSGAVPTPIKTSYIQMQGGLDLVSPALQIKPGACIDAGNFVPEISGGYKRVGGYEGYDGQTKPSDAAYGVYTVSSSALMAVGNTITGVTSAQTAKVLAIVSATSIVIGRASGTFTLTETLNISASPVGTLTAQGVNNASTVLLDRTYANLAAADRRTDILAVPGSGSILGVWYYNGLVYAFRNNAGGTAANMWKSSGSGWTAVTTAALTPGGRYEFVNHNFSGAATGLKMYGVDGVNKAFQFDGTTFTQITSTASPDTPSHLAAHQNRLFLSVLGSLFVSSPGDPITGWAGVGTTPAEIGTGDTITALLTMPGDSTTGALAVYGRNRTSILYGTSTSTWAMKVISPDAGAIANTTQYVSLGLGLDDRGVTSLAATQNFGNFAASSISAAVRPFIEARQGLVTGSSVLRSQNQYRLYFSDGYGLVFRVENGQVLGIMPIFYPDAVACAFSGEDTSGAEIVFFGSTDGFVYQAEIGTSFDGTDIEAWVRLGFNAERSPTTRKRWRRAVLEMQVPVYAQLYMTYELDYGDYSIPIAATALEDFAQTTDTPGGGGFWDAFTWDSFTWDSPLITPPRYDLNGTSQNISVLFFTKDALSEPFTIQSLILHYSPRRLQR